ncbi:MAG TPA: MFS transporter [Candidatus Binatia bacterium]|nr:MFS transporter [Candidatus Binatia bacterium]
MRRERFFYGWVVLGAAALITCVGMGALFSLGVFLKPIEQTTGWSRTGISTIALLNWIFMGLGSFLWGSLSDRFGTRVVVLAGGALLGLGLVLSSQVTALWQLHLTFGGLVGLAVGAFYAPLTSTATKWFTANRGLAVAIVSAGIGLGVLLVSPLARWLATLFDWRIAMLILGDLAWLVVIPAALLIRDRPGDLGAAARGGPARIQPEFSAAQVWRAPQFWVIALTHFACCAAHSGPIFHMVTHAIDQGVRPMTAATVLSVSGLSSIFGRVGAGVLADRIGAKPTLVGGLALQAGVILLYLVAGDARTFYLLGLAFGTFYGGVMPLYALVTREYFGEKVMGSAYGGVFLVSTLGMGLGSFAGGLIYDRLGGYAWLFLASAAIGGLAALLAVTFRPPRTLPAPVPVAGGR